MNETQRVLQQGRGINQRCMPFTNTLQCILYSNISRFDDVDLPFSTGQSMLYFPMLLR